MLNIDFDTSKLMQSLTQLASDIQNDAIRSAAFAASKVLYEEMRLRVPVGETHNLYNSIYQFHIERNPVKGVHTYAIGPNQKKGRGNHWHLLEYGHWQTNVIIRMPNGKFISTKEKLKTPKWIPAKPFIRPTFDAKIDVALDAARARLSEKVKELSNA